LDFSTYKKVTAAVKSELVKLQNKIKDDDSSKQKELRSAHVARVDKFFSALKSAKKRKYRQSTLTCREPSYMHARLSYR
jgi:hypothetical protein